MIIIVASLPLGMLLTLTSRCKFKPVSWLSRAYIFVVRGTPLMLQLLFLYFGVPFIPIIGEYIAINDRFAAAAVAFSLNYAAYFAEIFRGGLLAVDKGQYEAAQVLGLNKFQTMIRIVFPQMIRVSLPSISNEKCYFDKRHCACLCNRRHRFAGKCKTSGDTMANVTPYIVAAVIYLLLNTLLTMLFHQLEKKFSFE